MKFSKKNKIILFTGLIVLNLILRVFVANHETQNDSFEMHLLANSISKFGEAKWWVSPLSIVGMYPNSYASAIAFILSGLSQVSGIEVESVVFLISLFFGFFSIFLAYLLAGKIYNDDFYKFIVSFSYSLSPGILTDSTWTAHARAPFEILLPLLIVLLFSFKKNIQFKLLTVIISALLFATHHMFFYIIPFFFVLISIYIIEYIKRKNLSIFKISLKNDYTYIILAFLILMGYSFANNKFMTVSGRWNNLGIMLNEYPRYIGLVVFLSIGGLFYLIFKSRKSYEEWFLLLMLISISPFYFEERYMKWFILIFAFLLAGVGFQNLRNLNGIGHKIITIFMISSIIFSSYFQYLHEYKSDKQMSQDEFETSIWISKYSDNNFISNSRWVSWRIAAISNSTFLTGSATSDQAYGLVDVNEFEFEKNPITSEQFWLDSPFKRVNGTVSDGYWQIIMEREYNSKWSSSLLIRFNITMFLEDKSILGKWYSHHGSKPSEFVSSVYPDKSKLYDSVYQSIWELS